MTRPVAISIVLFGATLMSFIGLLLRLIENADAFQIIFYRSISLSVVVLIAACLRRKAGPMAVFASIDRWSILVGLLLGLAFSFYVYALVNTSIASGLFLLSSSPIFAAVLAWIIIKERPSAITYLALFLAIVGVAIMVMDGFQTGSMVGNLCALFSSLCFAAMLVVIRYRGQDDPLEGTFLGGIFAIVMNACVMLAIGSGFSISLSDLGLSLFMGAFTIGLGITFVTWAAAYLPSSEVSLLVLLESVLGPLWVWLFLSESTTVYVLTGGAIVLAAVILQTVFGNRKRRIWLDTSLER